MRVLIATRQRQGHRPDDYFHAVDGELVRLPTEPCIDQLCPCGNAVIGVASSRATTTFTVGERDLDPGAYGEMLRESLTRDGLIEAFDETMLAAYTQRHLEIAEEAPDGAVMRVRFQDAGRVQEP